MKQRFYGALLFLLVALFYISPSHPASAQEDDGDYVMVDMKTGAEQTIDLDQGEYSEDQEFVSEPSIPTRNKPMLKTLGGFGIPGVSTYSIIGSDDRRKVTNTDQYPYTTIARLEITYQDGTVVFGTGAMINPRLLATVGHLLINSNGSHLKSVRIEFGRNGNFEYYNTSQVHSYIYRTGFETDRPVVGDYGFIVFKDNTVSRVTGYMGIVTVPSMSDQLYTAGYPADKWYYYMYATTGKIVNMEADLIYHNMDTQPGQSGSPVYIIDSASGLPYLVAMHSSGAGTVNIARRLEPELFYWLKDHGYFG